MKDAPRAILFDALGTLLRLRPPAPRLRALLAERHGVTVAPALAERAFAAEMTHYRAHLMDGRDEASLRALRAECAEVLGQALGLCGRLDTSELTELLLSSLHFDAFPDAPGALRWARGVGACVVVVSNWDASLHEVLGRTGLDGLIDGALSSAEIGARKPDPAIFHAALKLCGCGAEEAVHVGDSLEEDIAGARAAGLRCVLVRREGAAPRPARASLGGLGGVPAVATLAQLPALISPR